MKTPATWIENLKLQPHPEGGFYREIYQSKEKILKQNLPERFQGDRSYGTAIYYLLQKNDVSCFHRVQSDEIWHHYDGCCVCIHVIHANGKYEMLKLGKNFENGEQPQAVVLSGTWFGAELAEKSLFALVGCTVAPGFHFDDFEMGDREKLLQTYPAQKEIILKLTKGA